MSNTRTPGLTEPPAPYLDEGSRQLLRWLNADHLPHGPARDASEPFCKLAREIVHALPQCAERTAMLRKLLEAKDCAVRAALS